MSVFSSHRLFCVDGEVTIRVRVLQQVVRGLARSAAASQPRTQPQGQCQALVRQFRRYVDALSGYALFGDRTHPSIALLLIQIKNDVQSMRRQGFLKERHKRLAPTRLF